MEVLGLVAAKLPVWTGEGTGAACASGLLQRHYARCEVDGHIHWPAHNLRLGQPNESAAVPALIAWTLPKPLPASTLAGLQGDVRTPPLSPIKRDGRCIDAGGGSWVLGHPPGSQSSPNPSPAKLRSEDVKLEKAIFGTEAVSEIQLSEPVLTAASDLGNSAVPAGYQSPNAGLAALAEWQRHIEQQETPTKRPPPLDVQDATIPEDPTDLGWAKSLIPSSPVFTPIKERHEVAIDCSKAGDELFDAVAAHERATAKRGRTKLDQNLSGMDKHKIKSKNETAQARQQQSPGQDTPMHGSHGINPSSQPPSVLPHVYDYAESVSSSGTALVPSERDAGSDSEIDGFSEYSLDFESISSSVPTSPQRDTDCPEDPCDPAAEHQVGRTETPRSSKIGGGTEGAGYERASKSSVLASKDADGLDQAHAKLRKLASEDLPASAEMRFLLTTADHSRSLNQLESTLSAVRDEITTGWAWRAQEHGACSPEAGEHAESVEDCIVCSVRAELGVEPPIEVEDLESGDQDDPWGRKTTDHHTGSPLFSLQPTNDQAQMAYDGPILYPNSSTECYSSDFEDVESQGEVLEETTVASISDTVEETTADGMLDELLVDGGMTKGDEDPGHENVLLTSLRGSQGLVFGEDSLHEVLAAMNAENASITVSKLKNSLQRRRSWRHATMPSQNSQYDVRSHNNELRQQSSVDWTILQSDVDAHPTDIYTEYWAKQNVHFNASGHPQPAIFPATSLLGSDGTAVDHGPTSVKFPGAETQSRPSTSRGPCQDSFPQVEPMPPTVADDEWDAELTTIARYERQYGPIAANTLSDAVATATAMQSDPIDDRFNEQFLASSEEGIAPRSECTHQKRLEVLEALAAPTSLTGTLAQQMAPLGNFAYPKIAERPNLCDEQTQLCFHPDDDSIVYRHDQDCALQYEDEHEGEESEYSAGGDLLQEAAAAAREVAEHVTAAVRAELSRELAAARQLWNSTRSELDAMRAEMLAARQAAEQTAAGTAPIATGADARHARLVEKSPSSAVVMDDLLATAEAYGPSLIGTGLQPAIAAAMARSAEATATRTQMKAAAAARAAARQQAASAVSICQTRSRTPPPTMFSARHAQAASQQQSSVLVPHGPLSCSPGSLSCGSAESRAAANRAAVLEAKMLVACAEQAAAREALLLLQLRQLRQR
eukprot:SAG31_NODE_566_length_14037_cov_32.372148_1_plen_1173_part_00